MSADRIEAALFVQGWITLHSGEASLWKIECDRLTEDDWNCLALMFAEVLPPFGSVEGVPRGGLALASALQHYARPGHPTLLVDDVWTTGGSMREQRGKRRDVIGAVVFARGPVDGWVTPLFAMPAARAALEAAEQTEQAEPQCEDRWYGRRCIRSAGHQESHAAVVRHEDGTVDSYAWISE